MSKPLKILIVHNHYQQRGGEDSVFETECAMLRGAGHTVICYEKHNDEIGAPQQGVGVRDEGLANTRDQGLGVRVEERQSDQAGAPASELGPKAYGLTPAFNTEAQRHREESVSTTERTEVSERVARQSENSNLKSRVVSQTLCASPSLCLKTNSAQPPSPSPSPSVLSVSSVVKKTFFPFVLFVSYVVKKTRRLCSHLSLFVKTIWNRTTYREITEIIQREKPDIVHCHNTFPLISPSVYYAAAKQGVPVVQTLHNYRLICINPYLYRNGKICEDCLGHSPIPGIIHRCYRDSLTASFTVAVMLIVHRLLGTYRNKVTTYIALTEFGRNKFLEARLCSPDKVVVKPNAVAALSASESTDLNQSERGLGQSPSGNYALRTTHYALTDGPPTVLYAGRLSPEKGPHLLLEAWKILSGSHPDIVANYRLVFAGDGPQRESLKSLTASFFPEDPLPDPQTARGMSPSEPKPVATSASLNGVWGRAPTETTHYALRTTPCTPRLNPPVIFTGRLPSTELHLLMRNASVLVLPSTCYETFAMSVNEAAALGTPSIVSDIGGQASIVQDGITGYTFKSGNVKSLAETIFNTLSAPEQLKSLSNAAKALTMASDTIPKANTANLLRIYLSRM